VNCERKGKLIGGCKFEPRYSLGEPRLEGAKMSGNVEALIEAMKPKTYIHDICIHCGAIVKPEAA
jgi:hypothetical protein